MPLDNNLLTFAGEGSVGFPSPYDLILRDDEHVVIFAERRKNADSEWEVRGYVTLGIGVRFTTDDPDRAGLAATFVEEFDADQLTTDERMSTRLVRYGVPAAVAVDGRPAIAAWLYVRGDSREEIADVMDVGERTVGEYLSRFRRRGSGLPDDIDAPDVGAIVPEIPPAFDPTVTEPGGRLETEGSA